jgi:hypothetical protein
MFINTALETTKSLVYLDNAKKWRLGEERRQREREREREGKPASA